MRRAARSSRLRRSASGLRQRACLGPARPAPRTRASRPSGARAAVGRPARRSMFGRVRRGQTRQASLFSRAPRRTADASPRADDHDQAEANFMNKAEQKIVQYLSEARGMERALAHVLQSQIAMTPKGAHRNGLESHLQETYDHGERVQRRLDRLGAGGNPLSFGVNLLRSVVGEALALGKAPVDLVRGSGGEEKVLKNAEDACAAEAREI